MFLGNVSLIYSSAISRTKELVLVLYNVQ